MSGTHSILAPSSAHIWMQCAASVRMQLPYANDPPTPESAEGDAAHWLALQAATGEGWRNWLGQKAPNGVAIDQDMIDGAELFADVVGPGATHERQVAGPSIHPHLFGTPDADRCAGPGRPRALRVYDYKYGHRTVEVFELWQCLAYAISLLDSVYSRTDVDEVEIVVVQPRSYGPDGPVRTWRFPLAELQGYVARMHKAAHAAVSMSGVPHPNAPATTGPACGDCKGRHECTLFQSVAARLVDETGRTERYNLPPAQLGAELSYLDESIERLAARRDGLAVQAETHLRAGAAVPGYGMEPGQSREKWNAPMAEVTAMADVLGVEVRCPPELITPTQARTALKRRALDPKLLDEYALRPPGAMKLTRSSTIHARKAFGAK